MSKPIVSGWYLKQYFSTHNEVASEYWRYSWCRMWGFVAFSKLPRRRVVFEHPRALLELAKSRFNWWETTRGFYVENRMGFQAVHYTGGNYSTFITRAEIEEDVARSQPEERPPLFDGVTPESDIHRFRNEEGAAYEKPRGTFKLVAWNERSPLFVP